MRLRILFVSLFAIALSVATANAGPVYLSLVLDPATAANAAGNDGTSTQSGVGSWHLYAFDDHTGSLGIANYSVTFAGINTILNRTPSTLFDPDGGGDQDAGFRLLRSANDTTAPVGAASNPMTGSQPLPGSSSINPILGFGQASSDFATKLPAGSTLASTTSTAWGDYNTDPPSSIGPGLFLAEGTYTVGTAPTITASRLQVYVNADTFALSEVEEVVGPPPGGGTVNTPPNVVPPAPNLGVTAGTVLLGDFNATDTETPAGPFTFSGLALSSFVPLIPGATNPAFNASLNPATGVVTWDTTGFARGNYLIQATVSDQGPGNPLQAVLPGQWAVQITQVPEPSTFALCGLAMVGFAGLVRRRNS